MPNPNKPTDPMHEARAAVPTDQELESEFDRMRNDQPGSVVEFTSLANEKSPEEYAAVKGLKVKFPTADGRLISGRLVDWSNDSRFRVVGYDGEKLISEPFSASELYRMPENSHLKGAVEFARTHADELEKERSQISSMLSSLLESKNQERAA